MNFGEQSWIHRPRGHSYPMLSYLVATDKLVNHNVSIFDSTFFVIHVIGETLLKMTMIFFE